MKKIRNILPYLLLVLFIYSCNDGIDPLTEVAPGPDATAPDVMIKYPVEGTKIKVNEPVVPITIEFEVTDDIEVADIQVLMDGTEIAMMSDFLDYRRVLAEVAFDNVTTGVHELKVTATDLDGKSTTSTVNFEKEPPYIPLFPDLGEQFYMAFDGDYTELITVTKATKIGTPGFSGEGVASPNAYAGAIASQLTFPVEKMNLGTEITGMFWYKVNASPDRAGILVIGDNADDRKQGFRLFREGSGTEQRIKLNVGTGDGESWNDGGVIDVTAGDWVNVAFTISETKSVIYLNGIEQNSGSLSAPIDWTGVSVLDIASGGETFSYWGHANDLSYIDELRFFDTALSQEEIQNVLGITNPYEPADGETLYMTFDDNFSNKVGGAVAEQVGSIGFASESKKGSNAFAGAADSYLTYPIDGLFGEAFSVVFWYKVNADPDRAGIIAVGNDTPENRMQGFRIFREGDASEQRIKSNIGIGTGEVWNDGDVIDVTAGEWVHIAITVSTTKSKIFFNGVEKRASDMASPIDWAGCSNMSIGSGMPSFGYWNHLSDSSYIDELKVFNKALSSEEIQDLM
ncbi:LamG domain-containing protein [Aureibaculum sp. A20]|uniref:LamG domain-containing protein n=1 Tax=Aureibaculum flavum TaxID=2795986 RepID=A0ABS0WRS2_9FLAO|nr:LamG domain-containing protein [Aureibaculum flavum]MBJ2174676.1 LamG domain-containing protein [Aureibaculum flavum]